MDLWEYISKDVVVYVRNFTLVAMIILTVVYVFIYARPLWPYWEVKERLIWISHFMFCLYFIYGTFEYMYLGTSFRVLLALAALLCLLVALVWPSEERADPERK